MISKSIWIKLMWKYMCLIFSLILALTLSLSLDLLHFFHSVYLMPLYAFCFLFTQGFDSQGNLYKPIQHLIEDADVDITTAEELIQVKKDNSNDYKKPPHTILNEEEAEEIPVHGSEGGWVEIINVCLKSISRFLVLYHPVVYLKT